MIGDWLRRLVWRDAPVQIDKPRRQYRYSAQSATWSQVVAVLAEQGPQTAQALRAQLGLTSVPAILAQMKRDGLVSVSRVTVGSRAYSYQLTEAGREAAERVESREGDT